MSAAPHDKIEIFFSIDALSAFGHDAQSRRRRLRSRVARWIALQFFGQEGTRPSKDGITSRECAAALGGLARDVCPIIRSCTRLRASWRESERLPCHLTKTTRFRDL
jgi:hypothetical protein